MAAMEIVFIVDIVPLFGKHANVQIEGLRAFAQSLSTAGLACDFSERHFLI